MLSLSARTEKRRFLCILRCKTAQRRRSYRSRSGRADGSAVHHTDRLSARSVVDHDRCLNAGFSLIFVFQRVSVGRPFDTTDVKLPSNICRQAITRLVESIAVQPHRRFLYNQRLLLLKKPQNFFHQFHALGNFTDAGCEHVLLRKPQYIAHGNTCPLYESCAPQTRCKRGTAMV